MISVGESLKNNDCTFKQRQADIEREERIEAEQRRREHASAYKHFIQLNEEQLKNLRALNKKSSVALNIWLFLIEHCDYLNAVACSSRVLEEALGYSRTTVYEGVKILKECGIIGIRKMGTANVYLLNPDITWKSWSSNLQNAEFRANVLTAASEQEKLPDVKDKRIIMPVVSLKEDSQPQEKNGSRRERKSADGKEWWEDEQNDYEDEWEMSTEEECPEEL